MTPPTLRLARFALFGLALLIASCAKGDGKSEAAGKVVALEGTAHAQRASDERRPLAVGDIVFPDDVVEAAPSSEVVVRLDRNGAPLRISNGAKQKVSTSVAWSAPSERGGDPFDTDKTDPTGAAGRSGDRESGSNASTATPATEVAQAEPKKSPDKSNSSGETKSVGAAMQLQDTDKMTNETGEKPDPGRGASMIQPAKNGKLTLQDVAPEDKRDGIDDELRSRAWNLATCLYDVKTRVEFVAKLRVGKEGAVEITAVTKTALDDDGEKCVREVFARPFPTETSTSSFTVRGAYD